MNEVNGLDVELEVYLYATWNSQKPMLEIRKRLSDKKLIKQIIDKSMDGQPIKAKLIFLDALKTKLKLKELGLYE